jgi:hypothetical protein
MGVALWYAGEAADTPSVAELSFKYKSKKEAYAPASVQRAKILFEGMQGLSAWVATASQTKTSFVYDAQPGFCGGAAD